MLLLPGATIQLPSIIVPNLHGLLCIESSRLTFREGTVRQFEVAQAMPVRLDSARRASSLRPLHVPGAMLVYSESIRTELSKSEGKERTRNIQMLLPYPFEYQIVREQSKPSSWNPYCTYAQARGLSHEPQD